MIIKSSKGLGEVLISLLIAEIILILLSWILSAACVEGVRSLLSGEGVRWFVGDFARMMASPLLVWLILLLMAIGAFLLFILKTLFPNGNNTILSLLTMPVTLTWNYLFVNKLLSNKHE